MRQALLALMMIGGVAFAAPSFVLAKSDSPRMNDVQVVGSHNSFKARMPEAVMAELRRRNAALADALDYYHPSIAEQLDRGVRQLEIDIFADPDGGRFAHPAGETLARAAGERTDFNPTAMQMPGFKVLHIPDVDYLSNCGASLRVCLGEVAQWSRAHPDHLPIMITLNAADVAQPGDVTQRISLDNAALLDALDTEIRQAIPGRRLITPDEVRGNAATLREAIRAKGWPALRATRGRIYVVLDVRPAVSEVYRAGHPGLRGRAAFGWYEDGDPDAVMQIVQDPLVDGDKIRRWVEQGVIVRTRTDANTVEARHHDFGKAKAAFDSGAQAVSTDYYPGAPDPLSLRYQISFPDGAMERANPVTTVKQGKPETSGSIGKTSR